MSRWLQGGTFFLFMIGRSLHCMYVELSRFDLVKLSKSDGSLKMIEFFEDNQRYVAFTTYLSNINERALISFDVCSSLVIVGIPKKSIHNNF